jgi:hypothetical protein
MEDDELIGQDRVQEPTSRPQPSVPYTLIFCTTYTHIAMSSSMDLTRDWLQNVLKPYIGRTLVLGEVMEILKNRRTLSVKTDAFSSYPLSLHLEEADV